MPTRELRIAVAPGAPGAPGTPGTSDQREVSALLVRPRGAVCLYVLAHGAGAGMTHPFMTAVADRLAANRVATLRFQFPYMEAGRKLPDREPVLSATVSAAIAAAGRVTRGLPVFAGGKSMGGRISSRLVAREPDARVRGLVFLGFPLHPAKRPGSERAAHLAQVAIPMLFIQGTRDALAEIARIRAVVDDLGERAALREIDDGDHSFHVRARVAGRRSGRTDADAVEQVTSAAAAWMSRLAR